MATSEVRVESERNQKSRDPEKRSQPFVSVLLTAVFGVPALVIVLRTFVYFDASLKWLASWLVMLLFGLVGTGVSVMVGRRAGRDSSVIAHVAITLVLFASSTSLGVTLGWYHDGETWWRRLSDIVHLPAAAVLIYFIGSVCVAVTWWLPRLDSYRASTSADGGQSGLEKMLKWPLRAKIRQGSITADEHSITAVIDHPGVPVKDLQAALPALVEQAGAIRGRSTINPGAVGGVSEARLVKSDPLKEWKAWPGLSHPGGSFAYPISTAYYVSTGERQWFSFVQTPESEILAPSPAAPKFRSTNDAHFGRQGATRSGKSGDNSIEIAEIASREDAILCFANAAKLMQDVGWAMDFATLAADTKPKAVVLFDAIRRLGEHRSTVMGDPRLNGRHRTWTPATHEELGFAAVVIEVDEGDQLLNGGIATWLATKGLSLGIYSSVMISRAATDGMASTLRSAITQWKAFGAGQAYDGGFVLSDETIAAGANVGSLSTRFPGSHYADKLNGVDETLYPELSRSFLTRKDFGDLRAAVIEARKTFEPAHFTPGELAILGEVADLLSPKTLLMDAYASIDGAPAPVQATARIETSTTRGTDMGSTLDLETGDRMGDTGDPEIDALLSKPRDNFDDLVREYGELPPPGEPMPSLATPGLPDVEMTDGRPVLSAEDTAAEFDAALVRLARAGKTEIGNGDVLDEMRCDPKPTYVSRRFKGMLDEGRYAKPDGVTLQRKPGRAGRYLIVWVGATGAEPVPDDAQ